MPKESVESQVLESVSQSKLLAGPGAPPKSGPTSGPSSGPSTGPSTPPSSGPSVAPQSQDQDGEVSDSATAGSSPSTTSEVYEDAGNGFFFRKLPDGNYDQTVYVKSEDGLYKPHEE